MGKKQFGYLMKIRCILPATAAALLAATVVYALLRWLCLISGFDGIKEKIWDFYLPMLFSAVITFWLLAPRIRIINDNNRSRSPRDFIYLIVWLMGIFMLGAAQNIVVYTQTASKQLESIGTGTDLPHSRYYRVNNTAIDLFSGRGYAESRTIHQRYSSYPEFHLYVVYPFEGQKNVWYGIHFSHDYRDKWASDEETRNACSSFLSSCRRKIVANPPHPSPMLERVQPSDDRDGYLEAIRESGCIGPEEAIQNVVILEDMKYIPAERRARNANMLMWTFYIGMAVLAFALLFMQVDRKSIDRNGKLKAIRREEGFFTVFELDTPANRLSAGIVAGMIGLFAVMTLAGVDPMSPSTRELIKWGAANHNEVFSGAWWLLISAIFVHSGALHLIGNLAAFLLCLSFATSLFGGPKVALIFLLAGISGTLAAVIPPGTAVVGASGAIMGVYGAVLTALILSKKRRENIGNQIWVLLGVVTLTLIIGFSTGSSNAAHIIGLVTGGLLGLLLKKEDPPRSEDPDTLEAP